jgi:hypothetical protein
MGLFFDDPLFEELTSMFLGLASHGGAELGEVQATCSRIVDGDDESWFAAWRATADDLVRAGDACSAGGHRLGAFGDHGRGRHARSGCQRCSLHRGRLASGSADRARHKGDELADRFASRWRVGCLVIVPRVSGTASMTHEEVHKWQPLSSA